VSSTSGRTVLRSEPADAGDATPSDAPRRSLRRAWVVGAAPGVALFTWLLTLGTFDLFRWQRVGYFYDAQAHALLGGHLAVNGDLLGVEAFTVRGNAYMYQGPVPALLRLPIVAIGGHSVDGRLTQVSMLAALVVILVFAWRLHWRSRRLLRGPAPVSAPEVALVGLFAFVLAGGSTLLYQASRAWVYHEALLWGAAFALGSIEFLAAYLERPSPRSLVAASAFAAGALLTRASVGVGPVVGLGLVLVGVTAVAILGPADPAEGAKAGARARRLAARGLRWLAPSGDAGARGSASILAVGAAAIAPLAAYAAVNYAKFHQLFSVPFYAQQFSQIDPGRRAFLAANDGTLFGLQFAPTTALQYLRPDALRFTSLFPFVDFAPFPGTTIGDVRFDLFDRSSSLPASQPVLLLLAVVGLVVLFRRSSRGAPSPLHPLRVPAVAAAAAGLTILPFGYVANRYLTDFIPLLVIAGGIGLQVIIVAIVRSTSWRRVRAGIATLVATLVVLSAFGTWVNLSLALRYQREWSYNLDPAVIAGFIGFQRDVNRAVGGAPIPLSRGDHLPDGVGRPGRLFVLGECDALYLSDGLGVNAVKTSPWNVVEQNNRAGHFVLHVRFPRQPVGTRVPIFTNGPPGAPNVLLAEYEPDNHLTFEYRETQAGRGSPTGTYIRRYLPFPIDVDHPYTLHVSADPHTSLLTVRLGDVVVLDSFYRYRGTDFRLGGNPDVADVARRFPGPLRSEPVGTPLCRALVRDTDRHR
jgi:hypothetical protein